MDDLPRSWVSVPEWGGGVYVRTLLGTERDQFEQSLVDERPVGGGKTKPRLNATNVRARLVVLCAVDATGARIFKDEDAVALGRKSGKALDRVFAVAQQINGLTKEDVEDLAGN